MRNQLPFRQVHLDFHTSEKIPNVASKFDKAQFQQMLQSGHVNSITLFSKCHHGMSYHDTTVGVRHPGMEQELLPRQLEAGREIDVKTPIYLSAGLDEAALRTHPEWMAKAKDGCNADPLHVGFVNVDPLRAGFKRLCFNTPYLDYLCAQIEEVVDRFGADDGIFLDIIRVGHCYCQWCLMAWWRRGLIQLAMMTPTLTRSKCRKSTFQGRQPRVKKVIRSDVFFITAGIFPKVGKRIIIGIRTWNWKACPRVVGVMITFRFLQNTPPPPAMIFWG